MCSVALRRLRPEFAEGWLDGVRIRQQIKESRICCFDRLLDACDLVNWRIVRDDDIVALDGWNEALLHKRETLAQS